MERRIFLKAIEQFHGLLVASLVLKNVEHATANDVVQNMLTRMLDTKSYARVPHNNVDARMRSYLMQALQWQLVNEINRSNLEGSRVGQLLDEEEDGNIFTTLLQEPTVDDIIECPFCHKGVLNEYGACALCHTIVGKDYSPREMMTLEKMVDSECPDLGMFADVNLALSKLDELERKVVLRIVNGNDTLNDLEELTRIPRVNLWRIWTRAKAKLQQELFEYSHVNAA